MATTIVTATVIAIFVIGATLFWRANLRSEEPSSNAIYLDSSDSTPTELSVPPEGWSYERGEGIAYNRPYSVSSEASPVPLGKTDVPHDWALRKAGLTNMEDLKTHVVEGTLTEIKHIGPKRREDIETFVLQEEPRVYQRLAKVA